MCAYGYWQGTELREKLYLETAAGSMTVFKRDMKFTHDKMGTAGEE